MAHCSTRRSIPDFDRRPLDHDGKHHHRSDGHAHAGGDAAGADRNGGEADEHTDHQRDRSRREHIGDHKPGTTPAASSPGRPSPTHIPTTETMVARRVNATIGHVTKRAVAPTRPVTTTTAATRSSPSSTPPAISLVCRGL